MLKECSNNYFPSTFLDESKTDEYPEIEYEGIETNKALLACPNCKKGKLFLKHPKRINGYAWVCSLLPYCKGKAKFCPNCKKLPAIHYNRCIDPGCQNSKLET